MPSPGNLLICFAAAASAGCAGAPAPHSGPVIHKPWIVNSRDCTPRYPLESRRNGEEGEVVARMVIDVDGRGSQLRVIQSSGFARLDEAALEQFRCLRFLPGRIDGVPSPMSYDAPIRFVLRK